MVIAFLFVILTEKDDDSNVLAHEGLYVILARYSMYHGRIILAIPEVPSTCLYVTLENVSSSR